MIENDNDLLFAERLQRELDMRFTQSVRNAAESFGQSMLTTDAQVADGVIPAATDE
jgi:hypothetical protein